MSETTFLNLQMTPILLCPALIQTRARTKSNICKRGRRTTI